MTRYTFTPYMGSFASPGTNTIVSLLKDTGNVDSFKMAAGGIEPLPLCWQSGHSGHCGHSGALQPDHCSHIVSVKQVIKTFQLPGNEYQFKSHEQWNLKRNTFCCLRQSLWQVILVIVCPIIL